MPDPDEDAFGWDEELRPFHVAFMGSRQAGCIGLMALRFAGAKVVGAVGYDPTTRFLARRLCPNVQLSISSPAFIASVRRSDLLVSVHGREIVPAGTLALPRLGGINVHPCLSMYKGRDPIQRLLADGGARASVGVHRMTEEVDAGEVLVERFVDLPPDVVASGSVERVYNILYPEYALAIIDVMDKLRGVRT